mgnify:CR=1 FL=1
MSPVVTVIFCARSARGRFLNEDGTMNMERLRAALELPAEVDLGDLNFRVPQTSQVTVTTDAWTITVRSDD